MQVNENERVEKVPLQLVLTRDEFDKIHKYKQENFLTLSALTTISLKNFFENHIDFNKECISNKRILKFREADTRDMRIKALIPRELYNDVAKYSLELGKSETENSVSKKVSLSNVCVYALMTYILKNSIK